MGNIETIILSDKKNLSYENHSGDKKIFVYTPENYPKELKRYPVIYAFDGQNLFNSDKDYKCEAENSVALEEVCKKANFPCVIVGVYNGDGEFTRDRELTMSSSFGTLIDPFNKPGFKEGTLEKTGNFLIETLIPFIEENYKVSSDREKRILLGASSGGLASFYLGLKYDKIFGNICALSPATCLFLKKDWERFFKGLSFEKNRKILIYCGRNSSDVLENYLYNGLNRDDILSSYLIKPTLNNFANGKTVIKEAFLDNAVHNEKHWRLAIEDNLGFFIK